ncbi:LexA family protein [Snuella sedimenti]
MARDSLFSPKHIMLVKQTKNLTFFIPNVSNNSGAPFFDAGISAGFPSPAEDFKEQRLSLDKELIKNKEATFFARVSGQSMIGAGLDDNDLLVIDRSLEPANNKIAVCFLDGEFTVKRLRVDKGEVWLQPENPDYPIIKITQQNDFIIWGIVTNVIKKV